MMKKLVEDRPWGMFEQFCQNDKCTVKILSVKPGEKLSLQFHRHRDEFWRVIEGSAKVVIGDEIFDAKVGDEFFVERLKKHRIMTDEHPVKVLEISFGDFDEDDIVRVEDKYGRLKSEE